MKRFPTGVCVALWRCARLQERLRTILLENREWQPLEVSVFLLH